MELLSHWRKPDLEIGSEHYVWFGHSPDWPEQCECGGEHCENFEATYIWIAHPHAQTGEPCIGACNTRPGGWTLVSKDPLTLTPSVACSCGDHGFVTDGKWVRA